MTKKTNVFVAAAAAMSLILCQRGAAQDGLNGDLDDLLAGFADEPLAEVIEAEPAAEAEPADGAGALEALPAGEAPQAAPSEAAGADALDAEIAALANEAAAGEAAAELNAATAETAEAVEEAAAETAAPVAEAVEEVAETVAPAAEAVEEAGAAPAVEFDAEVPAAARAEALLAVPAPVVAAVDEPAAVVAAPAETEEPVAVESDESVAVEPAVVADDSLSAGEALQAAPAAAPADDSIDAALSEVQLLEQMRRKALDEHGRTSLAKAEEELKAGNYVEARRLFEEAKKFIVKRPENEASIASAERGAAESVYRQADVAFKRGNLDDADKLFREARELGHPKAADGIAKVEATRNNPPEAKPVAEAKRWDDRGYRKNREQVKTRIRRARQYLITGEYDKARTELELILRDNPYDADAILLLKRVSDRTYDSDTQEFNATRSSMIQQVRDTWTPSYRYAIDVPESLGTGEGAVTEGTVVNRAGQTPEEETEAKMRKITIPEINFNNATIGEVIDFFIDASIEYDDQQLPPEKRGVNIFLKPGQVGATETTVADDDPFAVQPTSENGIPPISLRARYKSLWDALQIVCDYARLKFRLRDNSVIIVPVNEADTDMVPRSYVVVPDFEERAKSMTTRLSSRSVDSEGRSLFETQDDTPAGGVDWKQLFEEMGVKWPNGSSIKYLPAINKLRVVNTPENIVEFEKALNDLNGTPRQVEIEARFVEVAQTDLESLGFEWLLTDDWEIAKNKKDPSQHIKIGKGSGTSQANRYISNGANLGNGISLTAVNDAILSVSSVLTNPELGFVLHMLSQQANTDLLSAPRVVTMNNEEAIIKVVREYMYPTEYEIKENDIDGDSDNIQVSYPSVEPQEFEMREVGVILQVTPQVSEDGQTILLQLNPQIISDPEWKDYGFDYPIRMSGDNAQLLHLTMEQPIFKVRSVSTKISIYNGATVVLGGMITEERNEVNDKVPFFGDIPLIGRLFRSNYERSEKRNLLIFVTARMVDPAGRTLKRNASDGAEAQAN